MSTNQTDEDSLVDEIEQLQIEYRATLLEKCSKTYELISQSQVNSDQADWKFALSQWKSLRDYAHKIAGSAGTYGFMTLSEAFRFIEDRIMDGSFVPLSGASVKIITSHWKAFVDASIKHYLGLKVEVGYTETLTKADQHLRPLWKKMEHELLQKINAGRAETRGSASSNGLKVA